MKNLVDGEHELKIFCSDKWIAESKRPCHRWFRLRSTSYSRKMALLIPGMISIVVIGKVVFKRLKSRFELNHECQLPLKSDYMLRSTEALSEALSDYLGISETVF